MPGIEELDSSVLLGEDENLSRKGSTPQRKQTVGRLAEASGLLIGKRLGREKRPRLLFDTTNTLTTSLPFAVNSYGGQMYSHVHEAQLFPIPISSLQRPTAATNMKNLVETESLGNNQTVPVQKDLG